MPQPFHHTSGPDNPETRKHMKSASILFLWLTLALPVAADSLHIATAANFKPALQALLADFPASQTHSIRLSAASTGTLYTQIIHGAPFDVLLAADAARPLRLEQEGYAVAGSRTTYAIGQLVLVYRESLGQLAESGIATVLASPGISVAIANPAVAPYGYAATEVLQELGNPVAAGNLLRASNILQAYQMWFSGGADVALVARSQVTGNFLLVPANWYTPLEQQAVLLTGAADKPPARAFMDYLQSERARQIIASFGYLNKARDSV